MLTILGYGPRNGLRYGALALTTAGALLAGCGTSPANTPNQPQNQPQNQTQNQNQQQELKPVKVEATFHPYEPGEKAITYQEELVPDDARVTVTSQSSPARTEVRLEVSGFVPNRAYGAHVHTKPCGATGDDAGPHFQSKMDPVTPSVDPEYANPRNEIWLDFTTDAAGNGSANSTVDWGFTDRHPASLVIHETHTQTERGKAGTAGSRLACVNVPF